MNVVINTPEKWDNAWIVYLKQAIHGRGHESYGPHEIPDYSDIVIHGWAAPFNPDPYGDAKHVMFLRRYEFFSGVFQSVDWSLVSDLICVNSWIQHQMEKYFAAHKISTRVHLVYNGTDLSKWTYKENRKPSHNIGMACHVHPKKNLPLALQILALLPDSYSLHIAGEVQDPATHAYLDTMAHQMCRKVYIYGHIPRDQLDIWWEQMGVCLSTSISEGNPNNVIEAMAKGIKPVIHAWPGASQQFPVSCIFENVQQAVVQIQDTVYDSAEYRRWVEKFFNLDRYQEVLDIAGIKAGAQACAS